MSRIEPIARGQPFQQDQTTTQQQAQQQRSEKHDADQAKRAEDDVGDRRFVDWLLHDPNDNRLIRLLKHHGAIVTWLKLAAGSGKREAGSR
jgi:hypothetical protein